MAGAATAVTFVALAMPSVAIWVPVVSGVALWGLASMLWTHKDGSGFSGSFWRSHMKSRESVPDVCQEDRVGEGADLANPVVLNVEKYLELTVAAGLLADVTPLDYAIGREMMDRFEEAINAGSRKGVPKELRGVFDQWSKLQKEGTTRAVALERSNDRERKRAERNKLALAKQKAKAVRRLEKEKKKKPLVPPPVQPFEIDPHDDPPSFGSDGESSEEE